MNNQQLDKNIQKILINQQQAISSTSAEVASEMQKLADFLRKSNPRLGTLPDALVEHLGAKSSKGWKTGGIANSFAQLKDELKVVAVLVHDTAFNEVNFINDAVKALSCFFSRIDFQLVLVHWEQLHEPTTDKTFDSICNGISSILESNFIRSELIVVDRHAVSNSKPFRQAKNELWDQKAATPCMSDMKWIIDFYARQNSCRYKGMPQALIDLTLRRGIGLLVHDLDPHIVLLTESKERLSRCYRTHCPAMNVKTKH